MFDMIDRECREKGDIDPIPLVERTVTSVINAVVFGYRFDDVSSVLWKILTVSQ